MAAVQTNPPAAKDIAVPKSIHLQIARFAFVHTLATEHKRRVKELKKKIQEIADAEEELILVDDEAAIPCQLHESSSVDRTKTEAEEFLQSRRSECEIEISDLEHKIAELDTEAQDLRTKLYGQLGSAVQLEEQKTTNSMALPPDLDVEQALLDYEEKQEKKKSSVKIFGKSISDIECFRDSFLYGILGGFGVGLTTFMFTSRGKRSMDVGFGSYVIITLVTFGYCRYDRAMRKWELNQLKGALRPGALNQNPSANPEGIEDGKVIVEPSRTRADGK